MRSITDLSEMSNVSLMRGHKRVGVGILSDQDEVMMRVALRRDDLTLT